MTLSSKKYFYVLCATLALLVGLLLAGFVGGNIILQKQAKKLTDLKIENKAVETQQTALLQAKKDIERSSELEKISKSVVPQDKDQAKTVREIITIAAINRVPIRSIDFDASTLGTTTAPGAAKPQAQSPGTVAGAKSPISQLKPVEGIPGVYTMEIRVDSPDNVLISYGRFINFLSDLEKNRRTAHVADITLESTQGAEDDQVLKSFKLKLNAYVKP